MRPRFRLSSALLALTVVCALLAALAPRPTAARRFEQIVRRLERDEGLREPLVGPSRSGNAWDDYGEALSVVVGLGWHDEWPMEERINRCGRPHSEHRSYRDLRKRLGHDDPDFVPERLRRGACCRSARPPVAWRRGFRQDGPTSGDVRAAGHLLLARACELRDRGDMDGALDDIAVCLQFVLDASRVPTTDASGFHFGGFYIAEPCGHGWGGSSNTSDDFRSGSILEACVELIAFSRRELDRIGGPRAAGLRARAARQYPSLREVIERAWVLEFEHFRRGDPWAPPTADAIRRADSEWLARLESTGGEHVWRYGRDRLVR